MSASVLKESGNAAFATGIKAWITSITLNNAFAHLSTKELWKQFCVILKQCDDTTMRGRQCQEYVCVNFLHHQSRSMNFPAGDYEAAIDAYTAALNVLPEAATDSAALHSNRSAAHERLSRYAEALSDADRAVALRPDWHKV